MGEGCLGNCPPIPAETETPNEELPDISLPVIVELGMADTQWAGSIATRAPERQPQNINPSGHMRKAEPQHRILVNSLLDLGEPKLRFEMATWEQRGPPSFQEASPFGSLPAKMTKSSHAFKLLCKRGSRFSVRR